MKVPKAKKQPSGSWFIQLRLGGKSIPVTAATEKACVREAQAIKAEYLAGRRSALGENTEQELTLMKAIDNYIANKSAILSPSTVRGYRSIQDFRFPSVMHRKIREIKDEEWQGLINMEVGYASATTVRKAFSFIRTVIMQQTGHVIPMAQITLPDGPPAVREFLQPDEIPVFVQAVKDTDVAIPALLALSSLRISEIYALRWESIGNQPKFIRVAGSVVLGPDKKMVRKSKNKNRSSTRNVPLLIPELTAALERERKPSGPVVEWSQNYVRRRIHQICTEVNITDVTVHGLRHSFASLAYHLRVPEQIAMEIGGWADQTTMHKIYTHIATSDITRYQTQLAEFFKNANENANEN